MTYADAIQFLFGLQLFGSHFGLGRAEKLSALAGNPEKKLRFIHVAGTNGKGSTCAMLESIYRAAGLRVGLFTSPHLVSFRERMQINRHLISQDDIVCLLQEIQPLLKQFPNDNHPTMFEVVTVMALKYFAEKKCDLVIWETGLGGRLDATNIVTPLTSVITNVALDHTQWLGDTVAKIAREKAGIIKAGVPVVTSAEHPAALNVINEVAAANLAPVTVITPDTNPLSMGGVAPELQLPLLGEHQKQNATLALAVVKILQPTIPVPLAAIKQGLEKVDWPGRLQIIRHEGRTFLLDGAHNFAGIETLCAALRQPSLSQKRTLILGMLADKDWRAMAGRLAPLAEKVLAVRVGSERAVSADQIAAVCRAANPGAEICECRTLGEALDFSGSTPANLTVIAGSLYLIGEALSRLDPAFATAADERKLNDWKPSA